MTDEPLKFPPHLQGRYRRFRAREKSRSLLLPRLFFIPHALIGLFLLFFAMPGVVLWAASGHDYTATVTRLWSEGGRRYSIHYHAAFHYDLPSGPRQTSDIIDSDLYQRLHAAPLPQRTLRVRAIQIGPFFFDKPVDAVATAWGLAGGICFFGLFWCAISGLFVYFLYIQPHRLRLLYRSGEVTSGKFISKRAVRGKSTSYNLRYTFTLPDGRTFEKEMPTKRALWENVQIDQPVTVLYSPGHPKRSIVYDYGPYECTDD